MKTNLPARLFESNLPTIRPIFNLYRRQGHSKISATLMITAVIVATAITYLLIRNATS